MERQVLYSFLIAVPELVPREGTQLAFTERTPEGPGLEGNTTEDLAIFEVPTGTLPPEPEVGMTPDTVLTPDAPADFEAADEALVEIEMLPEPDTELVLVLVLVLELVLVLVLELVGVMVVDVLIEGVIVLLMECEGEVEESEQ